MKKKLLDNENIAISNQQSDKIPFMYRVMSFIILSFIIFVHSCIFNKGIIFNPIVVCLTIYAGILFFRKQKFEDIIFTSNFSLIFLLFLSISSILNAILNIDNGYLFLVNCFYIFIFSAVWILNNPSLNLTILQTRYGKDNIIGPSFYYIIAGLAVLGIGVFATAATYGTEAKGTEINDLFKMLIKLGVVLLCFQGGNFFFSGLGDIICLCLGCHKNTNIIIHKIPEISEYDTKTRKWYRNLVSCCALYVILLLLNGYWQLGKEVLWLLLPAGFSLFLFYKLSLKKYSYEYTVGVNMTCLYFYAGLLASSAISMVAFSQKHNLAYDFNSLLQNMYLWSTYNTDFVLSFNILLFVILGMLLSLNSTANSINFYIRIYNLGYSPMHMAISHVFFLILTIYAVYDGIYNKTISGIEVYAFSMVLITFTSQVTFRFLSFYFGELRHNYLNK